MSRWAALMLAVSAAMAAPNLLVNGDGEQGTQPWGGDAPRVEAPAEAHGGRWVWTGTVDAKNQHRRVTQTLTFEAGNLYELSFWARSSNRNMVVLWLQQGTQRINPDRWENVPKAWTRLTSAFSVPTSGVWELQIILPSSNGEGPLGTAWADDFELRQLTSGQLTPLSAAGRLADHGTTCTGPDGTLWAAWEEYEPDRDRLVVARLRAGEGLTVERTWPLDFGAASCTLWPRLVGGRAGVWLVTAAEVNRQWDIAAVPLGAEGPGQPVWVTRDAAADARVAGNADGEGLWLAWQSNRDGQRRIWSAQVLDGRPTAPEAISEGSSYNPAVAVGGGQTLVAFDRFVGGNRDLYLTRREGGRWQPARRLTTSNRHDLNPQLVWWRDGLWVAWEYGIHAGYNICSLETKTIQLAQVLPAGLAAPVGLANGVPGRWIEQPTLRVDGANRLWLAYRQARGNDGRGGWDTKLTAYTGQAFSEVTQLPGESGRARPATIATAGNDLLVVTEADNVGSQWKTNEEATAKAWCKVHAGLVRTASAPAAADLRTAPYSDAVVETFKLQEDRVRMGEERAPFTFRAGDVTYTAYFGNFHEHSDISQCRRAMDSRTEEDYIWMREIGRIAFGAVTDHCYNQSPVVWRYSQKITRASHDPGQFVAFVGEEWTSNNEKTTKPPGYYGHRNLIYADPYFPYWLNSRDPLYFNPQQVWDKLSGQDYIMIPHQLADAGSNVPIDWDYTHERNQPVAEIFQARESYEADECPRRTKAGHPGYFLQDVWRRGIKIGVIASPDHGGGKGKAGVLVTELTRGNVLDACRARRSWGTSAAQIALALTVDGQLMGAAVKDARPAPARVHAKVSAAGPVRAVRVIRNNEIVYSHTAEGPEVEFDWLDNAPPAENTYYYLRVERQDDELAWSSPVWLDRPGQG